VRTWDGPKPGTTESESVTEPGKLWDFNCGKYSKRKLVKQTVALWTTKGT